MNPFHYSSPVPPDELIDRDDEAERLLLWAQEGNNSRLVAPRRYGKTSLLKKVATDAARSLLPVYVDFFGVVSISDVAERIERAYAEALLGRLSRWFEGLRRSLRPTFRVGVPGVSAGAEVVARANASLLERLALPRKVAERSGRRVLVVFDEFQDVLTAGPRVDAVVRSEIQHQGEVASYIFAGSQVGMMSQLFADPKRAFYAQARPISLLPLAPEDTAEFVTARFSRTGRDIGTALGPFLDVSAGHPQRTMLLAHHLWELTPARGTADEATFSAALSRAIAEIVPELTVLWSRLNTSERRVVSIIAAGGRRLYARGSEGSRSAAVTSAINKLAFSGFVEKDHRTVSGWRLVDPLFAEWARLGRPDTVRTLDDLSWRDGTWPGPSHSAQ